jgi:RNA polymerase subunit RPABC4/transcription elongation factor Spt4
MSLDLKKPKGRKARKACKGPVKEFRCMYCGAASLIQEWADKDDCCPKCERMHVKDDGCGIGWGN